MPPINFADEDEERDYLRETDRDAGFNERERYDDYLDEQDKDR